MHPKHPKCPKCGKALYKVRDKGLKPAKPEDLWRWCRNTKCELYGVDQITGQRKKIKKPVQKANGENELVEEVRKKVRAQIFSTEDPGVFVLSLTILAQELGHDTLANSLIEHYSLNELYGLQKK